MRAGCPQGRIVLFFCQCVLVSLSLSLSLCLSLFPSLSLCIVLLQILRTQHVSP